MVNNKIQHTITKTIRRITAITTRNKTQHKSTRNCDKKITTLTDRNAAARDRTSPPANCMAPAVNISASGAAVKDKNNPKIVRHSTSAILGIFGAILCNYRTNGYDDFKKLSRKLELFH